MLQLASPNISADDIDAVVRVLRSGMLVQGNEVTALENEIADYVGASHAIALTNGTATLHLALLALGIGEGDEVIVPSFSYIATANAVELTGATPVFVDITPRSFNINVALIEQVITTRTKAIMPVHEFGLPCDIIRIKEICDQHELFLIEDAACALGSTMHGKFAGTFGHFGSYSLHPRKAVTSGEGGILVTNDENLAKKIRILRNHGIEMIDGKMEFVAAGYNCRMTDFQAALVRGQLARLPNLLAQRRAIAERYIQEINNPFLLLPELPDHVVVNWQTFHLLVDPAINRDNLINDLRCKGINANYGAQCMPAQKFYSNKYNYDSSHTFPHGYHSWQHGLAIPAHEKLTENDITHIINSLQSIH